MKIMLVESRILVFGIGNTGLEIKDCLEFPYMGPEHPLQAFLFLLE